MLLEKLYPTSRNAAELPRYPVRVFLCAFMVQHHPEVVLDPGKPREQAVIAAALAMTAAFSALLAALLRPPPGGAGFSRTPPVTPVVATSASSSPPASPGNRDVMTSSSPPTRTSAELSVPASPQTPTGDVNNAPDVPALLAAFDATWLEYLDMFATWKGADASALESDLIRVAVELEKSMVRKCGYQP